MYMSKVMSNKSCPLKEQGHSMAKATKCTVVHQPSHILLTLYFSQYMSTNFFQNFTSKFTEI